MLEITKKDQRFQDVKFVAQAVSKDDTRPVLQVVCSNGKRLLACDGFRVHAVKMDTIPKGYYKVIVNNGSKIILDDYTATFESEHSSYPNIKQVWPRKAKTLLSIDRSSFNWSGNGNHILPNIAALLLRAMKEDQTINLDYLDDISKEMEYFTVKQDQGTTGGGTALLFQNGNARAVVMPIRM